MNDQKQYIGQLFDNRYQIEELLGCGGMSYVYLADDLVMDRKVSIKILKDNMLSDEHAVKRFTNEAKAISVLSHPAIVSLYDVSLDTSVKYIVMEYVDGITLKKYCEIRTSLTYNDYVKIIIQVLSALSHAHSKGIIHRDIKPQNILVNTEGSIKVTDFGISKLPGNDTVSMNDKAIGTANYINPEQASGKRIDARSDLYSVGVMLYEMVTSRLPFEGDSPLATAYMQIHDKPLPPSAVVPDVPKGLEQIILKALKKNPENRFQTADEMISCLERLISNESITFDFIYDEEAEDHAFANAVPKDVTFAYNQPAEKRGAGSPADKKAAPPVSNVKGLKKDKKEKKKKEKPVTVIVRKTGRVSILGIALGVLTALICVAVVIVFYVLDTYIVSDTTSSGSQRITIDDYTYMIFNDDFRNNLEKEGYEINVEWVNSSDHVANTIISQDPSPGETRMIIEGVQKCEINFSVSIGESMIRLPNYSGDDYRNAMIQLEREGLKPVAVRQNSESVPVGKVISTYPSAGQIVTLETKVTVYVSSGNEAEYVTIPDLRKKNSAQVNLELIKYGISLVSVDYEYSDTVDAGKVISQSILPGTVMQSGPISISITVSLGSDKTVVPDDGGYDPGIEPDPDSGFEDGIRGINEQ